LTSVGEYGWDGAARTHFWIDPAEDMLGLLMTQLLPAEKYPVTERFQATTYASIMD
jgi:CubicO group peptidase (beta-lactamase class C family)